MKKALVVYYTWSNGNTEGIAKQLQAQFDSNGGDEVITPSQRTINGRATLKSSAASKNRGSAAYTADPLFILKITPT